MKLLNKSKSLFLKIAIIFVITINILVTFLLCKKTLEKQPFISVVVTSYNYEKFLPKTIESILTQTYKKYEIIIIDDGSKDKSIDVIKKYMKKHDNIYLFTHENGINKGLIESMKLGIKKSRGEYVAFLESDDYWHKDNLLEKVKLINKYDDAFFISNAVEPFGDEDAVKIRKEYTNRVNRVLFMEKNIIHPHQLIDFNIIPTFSCVMVKKDILEDLNYNSTIPEFLDFWLYRQILLNNPLFHTRKVLTFWRQHTSYNNLKKYEKLAQKLNSFIKENNGVIFGKQ